MRQKNTMTPYRWASLFFFAFALYPYLSGGFALSVIPGWHTPIFSLLAVLNIAVTILMLILACTYIVINKQQPLRNGQIWQHLLLSIMPLIIMNFLTPLLDSHEIKIGLLNIALFAIVQIWFVVSLIQAIGKQRRAPTSGGF